MNFFSNLPQLALLIVISILVGCTNVTNTSEYKKCVENGISHFKNICSYPNLSSGQSAEDAAKEKCLNTTGAFDSRVEKPLTCTPTQRNQ